MLTFPQNVSSLDVRIHHRICDAQKHLLHTLVKPKKYIIENCIIYVTILRNVSIFQTSFPSKRNFRRVFKFPQNVSSLDVRIHHRICDAQIHLLNTLVKQYKYIIENCIIYVTILRNVSILSNIFSIEEKVQESVNVSTKRIFTRCENSSQNL